MSFFLGIAVGMAICIAFPLLKAGWGLVSRKVKKEAQDLDDK